LSFCLPFAMIPLLLMTRRRDLMGSHVNRPWTTALAVVTTAVVLGLNGWLLVSLVGGKA
jgi:manganese transport protein